MSNFLVFFAIISTSCSLSLNGIDEKIKEALCKLECSNGENEICIQDETMCDECTDQNRNLQLLNMTQYDTYKLSLKCKTDRMFYVEWNHRNENTVHFLHVLTLQSSFFTEITVCDHFSVGKLTSGTFYEVTLWSIDVHNVFISKPLKIETNNNNSLPSPVTNISVDLVPNTDEHFLAEITWKPGKDLSCNYEVILYCTASSYDGVIPAPDIYEITDPAYDLFNLTIGELKFGTRYALTIRSKDGGMEKESENTTIFFSTPTCLQTHANIDTCAPEQPSNVTVIEKPKQNSAKFDIVLNWSYPEHIPEYYMATLNLMGERVNATTLNISGEAINATFVNIELSTYYQVIFRAISKGGESEPVIIDRLSVLRGKSIESVNILLIILGILALFFTLGLLIIPIKKQRMTCENSNTRNQYEKNETSMKKNGEEDENIDSDKWEMSLNSLCLDVKLGEGAFGIVWQATFENKRVVACKMLKDGASSEETRQLLAEIEIMKCVGTHPNIVSMLGCVTKASQGPILIVEHCPKGDLLSYLRNIYNEIANSLNKEQTNCTNKLYELDVTDVVSFGRQIAMGMEYLSSQKVLHRDLAARNVLMCDDRTVKVSDFGLSRDVYIDSVYCKTTNGKLPIRWMALESLTHQIYTSQSDVWSFGVVLWEISTLGAVPYPGIETFELLRRLKRGERMTKPQLCSDEMYNVMLSCWRENPNERPTFTALKSTFEKCLGNGSDYLDLNNTG